jgi:drug/metabolite transporter (DMT)-like permease
MTRHDLIGCLLAGGAMTALGLSVGAIGLLADYPLLTSQAVRYAIGATALAVVLRARGGALPRPTRRDVFLLLALAATGMVGFNICLMGAVRQGDPAVAGIVVGGVPVALALVGPALARRAPSPRVLLAAVIVTAGAAAAQGEGGSTTIAGLFFALGALAGEVLFSLLAVPMLPRLGPLPVTVYACTAASLMLATAAIVRDGTGAGPAPSLTEVAATLYLALVVTASAIVAWYAGVGRLGVERAGLFAGLIPVAALAGVALTGTGSVNPLEAAGAVLVGLGVVLGMAPGRAAPASERGPISEMTGDG